MDQLEPKLYSSLTKESFIQMEQHERTVAVTIDYAKSQNLKKITPRDKNASSEN